MDQYNVHSVQFLHCAMSVQIVHIFDSVVWIVFDCALQCSFSSVLLGQYRHSRLLLSQSNLAILVDAKNPPILSTFSFDGSLHILDRKYCKVTSAQGMVGFKLQKCTSIQTGDRCNTFPEWKILDSSDNWLKLCGAIMTVFKRSIRAWQ